MMHSAQHKTHANRLHSEMGSSNNGIAQRDEYLIKFCQVRNQLDAFWYNKNVKFGVHSIHLSIVHAFNSRIKLTQIIFQRKFTICLECR